MALRWNLRDGVGFRPGRPINFDIDLNYTYLYFAQTKSLAFMTCAYTEYISFAAFIEPLGFSFWVVAVPSFIFIWLGLLTFIKVKKIRSFGSLWLLLFIVLEQSATGYGKLQKLTGLKCFLIAVTVGTMLPPNLYRGEVTSNLLAPFPRKRIRSIQEALDLDFKTLIFMRRDSATTEVEREFKINRNMTTELRWELLWSVMEKHPRSWLEAMGNELGGMTYLSNASLVAARFGKLVRSMTPVLHNSKGQDKFELKYLLRCRNEIRISTIPQLENYIHDALHVPGAWAKNLYINYLPLYNYWVLGPTVFDRSTLINTAFQSLIHSGILPRIGYDPKYCGMLIK